ncbi:hypothetical protein J3459_022420 [Metarhizium acridum]|uniref:Prolyl endopeptidase n=1 Tax=Metarhizium acridum (strain CQMa 102) TaxID=655827 RepID=E9ECF1_METAQ|nr:Prolyl endopeptidase [Metarhizium acridum CQMa 102]EFY86404.1 Prolyl endopeptidase [Metarhizium acridum CQMa 102]KAG8404969.1 hypothetical protein J3459_022420 [Metarhizium acridum]KAG8410794.1 hypothetical protein J3458_016883 [Metarhizium acridum]
MALATAHLRVARPTDNVDALLPFYCDGLGFQVLLRFKGHDGFNGVMLGHRNAAYHLEFTSKTGHEAGTAPTQDNLLVFYLADSEPYRAAVSSMERSGFSPVASFNPYWDKCGTTFEDADGYRIVLANMAAPI